MKTNELTGAILNWAVAKCMWPEEIGNTVPFHYDGGSYAPSRKWAHGGPIIEREEIKLTPPLSGESEWFAACGNGDVAGPTPLIAAMRCFVASRLGDNIEIPAELS